MRRTVEVWHILENKTPLWSITLCTGRVDSFIQSAEVLHNHESPIKPMMKKNSSCHVAQGNRWGSFFLSSYLFTLLHKPNTVSISMWPFKKKKLGHGITKAWAWLVLSCFLWQTFCCSGSFYVCVATALRFILFFFYITILLLKCHTFQETCIIKQDFKCYHCGTFTRWCWCHHFDLTTRGTVCAKTLGIPSTRAKLNILCLWWQFKYF